ncbi:MAG: phage holin family protein [Ardenticatenaceae bacterium]
MGKLITRLLINAVALWAAAYLVEGINVGGAQEEPIITLLIVALIFGLVNALIKPVLQALTCPFYVLTLGLFTFIVNALMLMLTAAVAGSFDLQFTVEGFGSALLGSIIISIVSFLLSLFTGDDD